MLLLLDVEAVVAVDVAVDEDDHHLHTGQAYRLVSTLAWQTTLPTLVDI